MGGYLAVPFLGGRLVISVSSLTRYYGAHPAVKDVSFSIADKEVVGFLGLNGAGKSTTLKVLAGLIMPTAGEVCIDGVNVLDRKMMPLQIKSWVRAGRKLKFTKFANIKKISDFWVAHTILAKTVRGKETESVTRLQFDSVRFDDPSVTADEFTQRRLEKGL